MGFDLNGETKSGDLDLRQLSPFQRVLLITDGTVTATIEAFLGEKMVVNVIAQDYVNSSDVSSPLDLQHSTRLLRRQILLKGERSHKACLYAESLIVPQRLPEAIRAGLLQRRKPIGELLQQTRLETFREITAREVTPAGDLATHFKCDPAQALISRTYRVFASRQPIMLITEKFPDDAFTGDPSP